MGIETERLFIEDGKQIRKPWMLSNLGIVVGTPVGDAIRILRNWLAAFDDEELDEVVVKAVREVYKQLAQGTWPAPTTGTTPMGGQQGGSLN